MAAFMGSSSTRVFASLSHMSRHALAGLALLASLCASEPAIAEKPVLMKPGLMPLVCRARSITQFAGGGLGAPVGALAFEGGLEIRCEGGLFGGVSGLT